MSTNKASPPIPTTNAMSRNGALLSSEGALFSAVTILIIMWLELTSGVECFVNTVEVMVLLGDPEPISVVESFADSIVIGVLLGDVELTNLMDSFTVSVASSFTVSVAFGTLCSDAEPTSVGVGVLLGDAELPSMLGWSIDSIVVGVLLVEVEWLLDSIGVGILLSDAELPGMVEWSVISVGVRVLVGDDAELPTVVE